MSDALMEVSVRMPAQLVHEGRARQVNAVALSGAFGLLPRHADHVAALVPSVLVLTEADGSERFFGVDHGLLVKAGRQVEIAVRRAVQGDDLASLALRVATEFEQADEQERVARTALSRLESGILRHLGDLRKPGP